MLKMCFVLLRALHPKNSNLVRLGFGILISLKCAFECLDLQNVESHSNFFYLILILERIEVIYVSTF